MEEIPGNRGKRSSAHRFFFDHAALRTAAMIPPTFFMVGSLAGRAGDIVVVLPKRYFAERTGTVFRNTHCLLTPLFSCIYIFKIMDNLTLTIFFLQATG
jgi:hypothetical protein